MIGLVQSYLLLVVAVALCGNSLKAFAQDLRNQGRGKVTNSGVIRFRTDTGSFRNAAPYTNTTNTGTIQFEGTNNRFTDLLGNTNAVTALGNVRDWRVPGLVRYSKSSDGQNVQARFYTNLQMAEASLKNIPDSVLVGGEYTIVESGPRQYRGTFFYDGTNPQYITQENALNGTTNRYNDLTILRGPKNVRDADEVRMDGVFVTDSVSPLSVDGDFFWGTRSFVFSPIIIQSGGMLTTGSGISHLHQNVDVNQGELVVKDESDTVTLFAGATLQLGADAQAKLTMGSNTQLDVVGNYRNAFAPLTNALFSTTSLVNYIGSQRPQILQATAETRPYGNVRTANSGKSANGNVYIANAVTVIDSNVVMIPHTMSLTVGAATYTSNAEVVGAFERVLANATANELYTYNNTETTMRFDVVPRRLTLDVRPTTRPNDFDQTTDINRKVTVRNTGDWKALVRVGYKQEDIPTTWVATASERLLKMFNAYGAPNERSIKLAPTVPPTYLRRSVALNNGLGFVELAGLQNNGADNTRVDNDNDILLRGSRDILKAISSGRWSNPGTWDEAREPEPTDRVQIDGFTVHVGYVRANDNYTINEAFADSMALSVEIGQSEGTSLLFGSTPNWDTFSLVPEVNVTLTTLKVSPSVIATLTQDVTATNLNAGLVVYPGSQFTAQNLLVGDNATVFNAGTLQVGTP
jgi:hypothetical protein